MPTTLRRPLDTPFRQQRLPAWKPVLTPFWVMLVFLAIGVPFVIIGTTLRSQSDDLLEMRVQYDGTDTADEYTPCRIKSSNVGAQCQISFTAREDMKAPVYVYYQLSNYFQNHRRYVKSYSEEQLLGCLGKGTRDNCGGYDIDDCEPLLRNGSTLLNPCGLIANSLFNDVIILDGPKNIQYSGLAWPSDRKKFNQPEGFRRLVNNSLGQQCLSGVNLETRKFGSCSDSVCEMAFGSSDFSGCKAFYCDQPDYFDCAEGSYYMFFYPRDDRVQYIYETFPEVVAPIHGVNSDRFQIWMRNSALPKFRKLYAKITDNIDKGETITFNITANFDVSTFKGTKSLAIAMTSWFGARNNFLGIAFIAVGTITLAFGVAFGLKLVVAPRRLGDERYLN